MRQILTVDKTGRVLLPGSVSKRLSRRPGSRRVMELLAKRIELTVLQPEPPPTALSPTGRHHAMTLLLDTSVVIASLDPDEPHHAACD